MTGAAMTRLSEWPNFPKVDNPDLWDFRIDLHLNGCSEHGHGDVAAQISEDRPGRARSLDRQVQYVWDGVFPRWVYQAELFRLATPTLRPWLSTWPHCSTVGDVDHLLHDCPTVRAAQRRGVRPAWGLGLLDVDGLDVCAWCRRVYKQRSAA